jgi:hypothetical protein
VGQHRGSRELIGVVRGVWLAGSNRHSADRPLAPMGEASRIGGRPSGRRLHLFSVCMFLRVCMFLSRYRSLGGNRRPAEVRSDAGRTWPVPSCNIPRRRLCRLPTPDAPAVGRQSFADTGASARCALVGCRRGCRLRRGTPLPFVRRAWVAGNVGGVAALAGGAGAPSEKGCRPTLGGKRRWGIAATTLAGGRLWRCALRGRGSLRRAGVSWRR